MRLGRLLLGLGLCLVGPPMARGQSAEAPARIETAALRLLDPDPYQVKAVLEPIRRVRLVAPMDGMIRSVEVKLGASASASRDLVVLDPTEADAHLKLASAELKDKVLRQQRGDASLTAAEVDAAQARVDLAKAIRDRCHVRAPFAGRVVDVAVVPGQFVLKGTTIVELVDTSSLRAVVPVDRRTVAVGSSVTVPVEDQEVAGKVEAVLPLPEELAILSELAAPFAAASVVLPNPKGELDAGFRARPSGLPMTPLANIPKRALRADQLRGASNSMVQVIRNEYVANVPVHVLGGLGPDRVQVSGAFRSGDALIVGSSVALVPGTLVRFNQGASARGIEGMSPNPEHGGLDAGITPPAGAPTASGRGTPYSTGAGRRPGTLPSRPASPPSRTQGGGAPPF